MNEGVVIEAHSSNSTFIMVFEDVWQALLGDPQALAVYMALVRRTYTGNRSWYSTKKAMAEESGVSRATFERRIEVLQAHGLVHVTSQYRNPATKEYSTKFGDGFTEQVQNIYTVRDHLPVQVDHLPVQVDHLRVQADTSQSGGGAPPHVEATPTSQRGDPPPHTEATPASHRGPNIDPQYIHPNNKEGAPLKGAPRRPKYSDDFEEFWRAYPRKGDKEKAQERFNEQLQEADLATLMKAVTNFRAQVEANETPQNYIPMSKTWLGQERWRDFLRDISPQNKPAPVREIMNWSVVDASDNTEEATDGYPF